MYKVLNINNKEYKLEYSIEASLYGECTEKVVGIMSKLAGVQEGGEEAVQNLIKSIADIPQTTIVMFYAGLLEHHGESGDNTVMSIADAKALIKDYIKSTEDGNFYDVLTMCINQMAEDGFFELIGLTKMFQAEEKKATKKPTDHQKKQTKVTSIKATKN